MTVRVGVRLGVDVGKTRIGVARSDPHGMLATPVETVRREHCGDADVRRILALAAELEAVEIVVGLPLNLKGKHTPSTADAIAFAEALAAHDIQVRLVDERMSTVSAIGHLHASGKTIKGSRDVVDQAAAVVILQHALDSERAQGVPAGTLVGDHSPSAGRG